MTSKILVGVDFSPESDVAVRQAVEIARRQDAEVVLCHVALTVELPPVGPSPDERVLAALDTYRSGLAREIERDRAELVALRERLDGQGPVISHVLAEGFPDEAIGTSAWRLGADLIVIGTHGRGGLRWFPLGGVAQRVVRHSAADVLVARRVCPAGGFRRVLVGIDFSPFSVRALDRAIALSSPQARIDVVHCFEVPVPIGWGATMAAVDPALIAELGRDLVRAGEQLLASRRTSDGPTLRFSALQEAAVPGLVHRMEKETYDLAALGSHGRRGLRRALLGSVAETVVRRAPCSVLVAHGDPAGAPPDGEVARR
jgi:nucleotide-binding universal stress UspA family protein